MGNKMDYKQAHKVLKQAIADNGFTLTQVRSRTKQQVAALLGVNEKDAFWSGGNAGFYINLKRNIEAEMQDALEELDRVFLQQQLVGGVRTAMRTRFPNFVIQRRKQGNSRILEVHLDGIPTVEVPI